MYEVFQLPRKLGEIVQVNHISGCQARGIGYSFQLAITTPRINLIGYGTATAQSYSLIFFHPICTSTLNEFMGDVG